MPAMTKTDTNVARVAAVVKEDHRVACWIIEKVGIPKTIMQRILHDNLKKWKSAPYRRRHEKTSYVSNYAFFTLLHKWIDRGQMHQLEKLQ